jgi:hypothetical protein
VGGGIYRNYCFLDYNYHDYSNNDKNYSDYIEGVVDNYGFMVRFGYDVSHFRFAACYNSAGTFELNYIHQNSKERYRYGYGYANYFSITIGTYIGGGRYKR